MKFVPTLLSIATALLMGVATTPAQASTHDSEALAARGLVGHSLSGGPSRGADRFWTPERMRLAVAAGPVPHSLRTDRTRSAMPPKPPRRLRSRRAGSERNRRDAGPGTVGSIPPRVDRRPGDAITSNLPVPAADENDVHGRLFFRQGRYYGSCSATVVNTRRLNLAVTAGHCLWLGKWSRHVVFVPAYSHGHRPYGSFVAKHAWIIRAWHRFPDINYDIGAVILRPNRFGRVGNVVGASGWGWNHSRRRQFNIFGYPAGHFRGEELRQCFSGSRRANWLSRRLPGPPTTGAFCDMAKGSSGGAWMTDDGDGDRYLDGITSYAGTGSRRTLFSPYFGTSAHNLITRAR